MNHFHKTVNFNLIKINKTMVEYVHIQIKGNFFERFGYFVNPKIRVCNRLDVFWERAHETTTRVELLPCFKFTGKMVKNKQFTGNIGKTGKR